MVFFLWEFLASNVFGLFSFSVFCLARGEQVTDAHDFGWQSKRKDHFRSWFPFFSCFLGDNSVLLKYCLVQRPFCIFLMFSSDLWSGTFFLSPFFLPLFDWGFFFAFSHPLIGNFSLFLFSTTLLIGNFFFIFFRGQGLTLPPWVKV